MAWRTKIYIYMTRPTKLKTPADTRNTENKKKAQ